MWPHQGQLALLLKKTDRVLPKRGKNFLITRVGKKQMMSSGFWEVCKLRLDVHLVMMLC